jgi:hypothetical protein|nr:MAG TPA: hypothetical protein [Caudoviricetes sp.]
MPNWCEGYLKIRGKREDLINFIENEILLMNYIDSDNIEEENIKLEFYDFEYFFGYDKSERQYLYLKNSHRFFIEDESIRFQYDERESAPHYLLLHIRRSWSIKNEKMLVEDSKKYHLDFNVYATERNLEFEEYITIIDGEITRNETKEYDDFRFEAINPELGG